MARKFVETLFYGVTLLVVLGNGILFQLPPLVAGVILVLTGAATLMIMLAQREPLPVIFWGSIVMYGGASFSEWVATGQLPLVGEGSRWMLLWVCNLLAVYYIVQNEAARKRALIFFAFVALLMVFMAGAHLAPTARKERLQLEGFSGSLGNANGLAFLTGFLAINLLFWSLRGSKLIRPVLWTLATVLVLVMIRTVSRGGIGTFGIGLTILSLTALIAAGVRLSGIVLIMVSIVGGMIVLSVAAESVDFLQARFDERSIRLEVFRRETLEQLWDTIVFGAGGRRIATVAGIRAHNSFLTTHMDYGGITAYPYLLMLLMLAIRTGRMVLARAFPLDVRLWIVALLLMMLSYQFFSNTGYVHPESVLALAMIAVYTGPYSGRAIRTRREHQKAAYTYTLQTGCE